MGQCVTQRTELRQQAQGRTGFAGPRGGRYAILVCAILTTASLLTEAPAPIFLESFCWNSGKVKPFATACVIDSVLSV